MLPDETHQNAGCELRSGKDARMVQEQIDGNQRILRDVLEAASEFSNRKLWKRFANYDCLGT